MSEPSRLLKTEILSAQRTVLIAVASAKLHCVGQILDVEAVVL